MLFAINDLKHYLNLSGAQILELFFNKKGADYSRAFNPNSSSYGNNRFHSIKKFIEFVGQAVESGKLQKVGKYYFSGGFEHGSFDKDEFFRWVQEDKVLDTLEGYGEKFNEDLKKTVEVTAKTETTPTTQPELVRADEQTQSELQAENILEEKPDGDCLKITFSKQGTHWVVGLDKKNILENWLGMYYIEYLLQRPKNRIPCITLEKQNGELASSPTTGNTFDTEDKSYTPGDHDDQFVSGGTQKGKNIEQDSFKKQKELVLDLKHDLDSTEDSDPSKATTEAEYNKQLQILSTLYDKHGNPRNDSSPESKARKNVSRAIQRARKNIIEVLPEMKTILDYIETGDEAVFSPPEGLNIKIQ